MSINCGGKGDKPRPFSVSQDEFGEKHQVAFGESTVKSGRYKQDRETGDWIPIEEWNAKYYKPVPKTHFIVGDIEPYQSPIDGSVINSRKDHREDLVKNGCRVYEGREAEAQEAQRYRDYVDQKTEKIISDGVEETYHDLKEGRIEKPDPDKPCSFTFGLD
jgi:predicted small secreted protein